MTCQQAEPLLARAADGTLDAERGRTHARHLDGCAGCREALDAQEAMRDVLAGRPAAPVPLGFATRVMANLPERGPASAAAWLDVLNWRAWTLRLAPLAAALFVGAALGPGPTSEEAGEMEFSTLVTAWVANEPVDADVPVDAVEPEPLLWQGGDQTDDLLIEVLLAREPSGSLPGAEEAGR